MTTAIAAPSNATWIQAQPGPQAAFLSSGADVVIYGGAAGAGKSYALLVEPLRHLSIPGFNAVIFRRTYPQITNPGGLRDTAELIYPHFGGRFIESKEMSYVFPPNNNRVKFAHMQHDKDRYDWDGSQICMLGFDQLEHFSKRVFLYMCSRNRSLCGVRPYVRATCNPAHPDHWLTKFLAWWLGEDGYPIAERSGVVRYFVTINDDVTWADTPEELEDLVEETEAVSKRDLIKSCTFIPGTVYDNKELLRVDPGYLANLNALGKIDQARLKGGNWNVREAAGMFFNRDMFIGKILDQAPACTVGPIRYWDRAGTGAEDGEEVDASHTAGGKMGITSDGRVIIHHMHRKQLEPGAVQQFVKDVANDDGKSVIVGIEQDPAQAGKAEALFHVRNLHGYQVIVNAVRENKGTRAKPLAAQAYAGNVYLVRGDWNDMVLNELHNFDGTKKCVADMVDSLTGGYHVLSNTAQVGVW